MRRHNRPGSTHLVAGLYEASRDHAPVCALRRHAAQELHGTDYIQATEPDLLFRDVSLYTETVSSSAQAPQVFHQAIAAAYAGGGVAHLTLPQDVIAEKANGGVSSVATLKPRPELVDIPRRPFRAITTSQIRRSCARKFDGRRRRRHLPL